MKTGTTTSAARRDDLLGTTTALNPSDVTTGVPGAADAAHTPGAWFLKDGHTTQGHYHYVTDAEGRVIVDTDDGLSNTAIRSKREAEANARLIAAAPDMLAALYEAREFIDGQIDVVDGDYGAPEPNRAMILAQEIDAAIAKATGAAQ